MSTWKKYGGVNKLDNLNNLSVHSFSADLFTLRESYYGTFDICGELHVSGDARADETIYGNNLIVANDIHANRLFVKVYTLEYSAVDISGTLTVTYGNTYLHKNVEVGGFMHLQNQLYLGNTGSTFVLGTSQGNIGINTNNPLAAFDISSSNPFALNVASPSQPNVYSIPAQNMHGQGFVMTTNVNNANLDMFVDATIQSGNIPDASIHYARGGYLTIDVSNNTNILSRIGISNRNDAEHVLGETVVIYDISAGTYLDKIYSSAKKGESLTMVATDASSITFINMMVPSKKGVALGGGVYPNDQTRAMGTMGWLDASANYTPAINMVSGNSSLRQKTTVGINTHAPVTESYALDINGPIHVKNGELTISSQPDFEILSLAVGKPSRSSAIAVGTPYKIVLGTDDEHPYKMIFLQTSDRGETWTPSYDLSGQFIEDDPGNQLTAAYIYDSSLTIIAGGLYAYYSYHPPGNKPFMRPFTLPNELEIINTIYVSPTPSTPRARVFFGLQSSVYWFDLSYSSIYSESVVTNYISDGSFEIPVATGNSITAMDGIGSKFWLTSGPSIFFVADAYSPTVAQRTNPQNSNYKSICILDDNRVIACGQNIISYTTDSGQTWNDVSLNYYVNSVCVIDNSNAVAVCNGGVVLYTTDGYQTWNRVPQDLLNGSGNADTLTDPNYNLTNVRFVDIHNFYITKTLRNYSFTPPAILGKTSLFHLYLPSLFDNTNNIVFDVSGSARFSGDLNVNDGGKISTNNSTFSLLNENVVTVAFGKSTTMVEIGNIARGSNVRINNDLLVSNNTVMNGNLSVLNNAAFNSNVSVKSDASFNSNVYVSSETNLLGNLLVSRNANISGRLFVSNVATMASNLNVLGNATIAGVMQVANIATFASNVNVIGNANIGGSMRVFGNSTFSNINVSGISTFVGNLNVTANINVAQNANITRQVFVGDSLYVAGNATMASNLRALNANITNIYVVGNTTFASNIQALSNVNISKSLLVNGETTMVSDVNAQGNVIISLNASVGGEFTGAGNVNANNINVPNTVYASNYDGYEILNAGVLKRDITMGLSVENVPSREIRIGNFKPTGTINEIYIGGGQDIIVLGGTVTNNQNIKAGPILYLNTPIFKNGALVGNNTSAGSGIVIADSGNASAGYIVVPSDKTGFLFKSPTLTNTNVVKFDVSNSVIPDGFTTGFMTMKSSPASSDSTYTMTVGSIDPSNVLLGNKSLATAASPQVIDTSFSIVGHMTVGSSVPAYTQSQCSLEVLGNIYQTNGLIWQF